MRRFATPTIKFHLKAKNKEDIPAVLGGTGYLTFGRFNETTQDFTELFDKDYEVETDANSGKTYLTCTLTQEESAKYAPNENAYVQFRAICGKTSIVSSITPIRTLATIKAEVL